MALTQAVWTALALAEDGHTTVGRRAALGEALDAAVPAGAAGARIGLPGVAGQ